MFQGLLEMRKSRFMKAERKRHGPAFKAKVAMEALTPRAGQGR